jgi:hypothetical protein
MVTDCFRRALKRALGVLGIVGYCWPELRIVGLIHRIVCEINISSAALREVSAAEWFRRGFGWLRDLLDSDPRLHLLSVCPQILTRFFTTQRAPKRAPKASSGGILRYSTVSDAIAFPRRVALQAY